MSNSTKSEEENKTESQYKIPNHIAIIMDGNRRWADEKKLPRNQGHREGINTLKRIVKHCGAIGVKYLTVYAFSTENWNRKKDEIDFLMGLIPIVIKKEIDDLIKNNVKIKVIGFLNELPKSLHKDIETIMDKTNNNTGLNLQVALNYGGRAEIVNAVRNIASEVKSGNLSAEDINQDTMNNHLLTSSIPDPDLLIRTGGEMRISNYLLWQCAYSEFYSTKLKWPEFSNDDLDNAILNFNNRHRRYGK